MEKIKAYKGFNKDLTCRAFQYEIGKEYCTKGNIECCRRGFHACEFPLEVLEYYLHDKVVDLARFCEVELYGDISRDTRDSKLASSNIMIIRELTLRWLIDESLKWINKHYNYPVATSLSDDVTLKDDNDVVYLNNQRSRVTSFGHSNKIALTARLCFVVSIGENASIVTDSSFNRISLIGNNSKLGSKSEFDEIISRGSFSKIVSIGNYAIITCSGNHSGIVSTGLSTNITSSGNNCFIRSEGQRAKICTSGGETRIKSTGDLANISSNGDYDVVISTGNNAVISCMGVGSKASAKKGSCITLAGFGINMSPICVKTELVDGIHIKEDTMYTLENGEFIEVKSY
jgi:hypothetical protein